MKRYVDSYKPGKWIPSCELAVQYELSSIDTKPVPLRYRVKLLGAREPHNMFTIIPPTAGARYGTHHSAVGQSSPSISSATKRSLEVDQSEGTDASYLCGMHTRVYVILLSDYLGTSSKKSRTIDPQPQTGKKCVYSLGVDSLFERGVHR